MSYNYIIHNSFFEVNVVDRRLTLHLRILTCHPYNAALKFNEVQLLKKCISRPCDFFLPLP